MRQTLWFYLLLALTYPHIYSSYFRCWHVHLDQVFYPDWLCHGSISVVGGTASVMHHLLGLGLPKPISLTITITSSLCTLVEVGCALVLALNHA